MLPHHCLYRTGSGQNRILSGIGYFCGKYLRKHFRIILIYSRRRSCKRQYRKPWAIASVYLGNGCYSACHAGDHPLYFFYVPVFPVISRYLQKAFYMNNRN
jgi:hypothetical protein